ncbi:hypothetical protein Patl1_10193 [Pistacia atlantica]|uniref:Uncharacterized protein n=1 Tax=Pistacia atlantica TaxID=434234 RepID=A0ACC1A6G7_9ROSI|nr:hypothetical protein Patl1_10193 [Pistacia atlantica]
MISDFHLLNNSVIISCKPGQKTKNFKNLNLDLHLHFTLSSSFSVSIAPLLRSSSVHRR